MTRIFTHPLREGVKLILEKHFAPEIVDRFKLIFEAQSFQGQNIINQIRDNKVAMEVYYDTGKSTEYITDVWSDQSHKEVEAHLLRFITDAVKAGKLGSDWVERRDGRLSLDISSGKHQTPDSEITKKMVREEVS